MCEADRMGKHLFCGSDLEKHFDHTIRSLIPTVYPADPADSNQNVS